MARSIPYRGKLGRERGVFEFMQHSDIPPYIMINVTDGKMENVAKDMRFDCLNQDGSNNSYHPLNHMTEEEYFKMWDRIDTKKYFRRGFLNHDRFFDDDDDDDYISVS